MTVPQSRAGDYQECGRSHSQCCPLQGSRGWQGHAGIVHSGQPGAWLGKGGRGTPVASPGTLTLLCQGSVPCLTGTSVFLCSLCTGVMGKTLDLQNKPHQGGAVLCWVPVLGSHIPEPHGQIEALFPAYARAEDLLPALARSWVASPLAGISWGRESLCPGLPLATLGGGPSSSPTRPAPSPVKPPAFPSSGKACGKG